MNTLAKTTAQRLRQAGTKTASCLSIAQVLLLAPLLLAGAYVALTPNFNLLPWLTAYDGKRLLQIGLLVIGAGCAGAVPRLRAGWVDTFRTLPAAARWGLGVVLTLGVASALTAPVPRYGLLSVAHYALLFSFGLTAASVCRAFPKRFFQGLLGALGIGIVLYMVTFGVGYAMHLAGGKIDIWPGDYIGFANKRFFNQFQSWSLPLLVLPMLMPYTRRVKGVRALAFACAAFWWMLAFASGGRGILLGLLVALVGVALLFRKKAWPWVRLHLAAGAVGAMLFGLLFKVVTNTGLSIAERAGKATGGRLADWQGIAEATWQHPWLGLGPMHTAYAPNELWPTTHNAVLQFVTEWGLPATVLLVGLALWGLFAWGRNARRRLSTHAERGSAEQDAGAEQPPAISSGVHVALTGSLLAAGTHAMVSGVVVMPTSQVMMALVLGAALGLHLPRRVLSVSSLLPTGKAQWGLVAFLGIGTGVLLWAIVPDAFALNMRILEYIVQEDRLKLSPRYWNQGLFGY